MAPYSASHKTEQRPEHIKPSQHEKPFVFREFWQRHHAAMAVVGCTVFLLGAYGWQAVGGTPQIATVLYILAYIAGGVLSLREGLQSLIQERRLDVDLLMVMAALAAAGIGEWLEGGVLLFLFSLSNAMQFYAMERTKRAVSSLISLRPQHALRKKDNGETQVVSVEDLNPNDVVLVRPGTYIPIDGTIVAGRSSLQEASITGESMPVSKTIDDNVFGGTLNENGVLEIRVTKRAHDTVLAKIIRTVQEAQQEGSPTQQRIDTIEQYYALIVIVLTASMAIIPWLLGTPWSQSLYRAVVLMVVASPCALAMAAPAPIVAAIAKGARHGVLFKSGEHMEHMASVKVVAFDKTGTLTEGVPHVTDVIAFSKWTQDDVLRLAASVERHSEHVLAETIVDYAEQRNMQWVEVRDVRALPGMGITARWKQHLVWIGNEDLCEEYANGKAVRNNDTKKALQAEGKTTMFVGVDDEIIGMIGVLDTVRAQARNTVQTLRRQGVERIVMLTGDNRRAAHAMNEHIGCDEVYAELLPDDKASVVRDLQRDAGPIMMIGDGINDAPALASATVGVAMGASGTDVALETADIVLMSNDLMKINDAVKLSRYVQRVMWQNIVFALGVIGVLVLVVMTRGLALAFGVIGHEGSTVLVILNSLRILVKQFDGNINDAESKEAIV